MTPVLKLSGSKALHNLHLLTGPAPPILDDLRRQAQTRFGLAAALFTLIDRERQIITAGVGTTPVTTPRSDAFCDYLPGSDEVLVVPDARQDARFALNPLVTGGPFVRFYAGTPLVYRRSVHLGGLCLLDAEPREFPTTEQDEVANLAEEATISNFEQVLDRFVPVI